MLAQIKRRPKRPADKRRLNELAVKKAKLKAEAYLIWDTMQRGLALRVQPTGSKSWVVVYSRHGRSRWLYLGGADAIGLADARMLAAETMLAVARGKDPAAEKKAERGAGTFAELAGRYLEQHAKKHNKSWRQADALIRRFAVPRWGKLQAAAVTRGDIKQMMEKIEAPIVANQTLAAVSAVFSWGNGSCNRGSARVPARCAACITPGWRATWCRCVASHSHLAHRHHSSTSVMRDARRR
jgi:hypothetical protein